MWLKPTFCVSMFFFLSPQKSGTKHAGSMHTCAWLKPYAAIGEYTVITLSLLRKVKITTIKFKFSLNFN
jgi:hypothetical protein